MLDAGNMNNEVFAQVMKTLVDSTGTALNLIKTSVDAQEVKTNETLQQVVSVVNATYAQGMVMQQHHDEMVDMKTKVTNAPQATGHNTYVSR